MRKVFWASMALALCLLACDKQEIAPFDIEAPLGQSTKLSSAIGANILIEKVEDSRCPINALCVWVGMAKVSISVVEAQKKTPLTLALPECTTCEPKLSESATVRIDGKPYRITLKEVSPYPGTPPVVSQSDYVVTLNVAQR